MIKILSTLLPCNTHSPSNMMLRVFPAKLQTRCGCNAILKWRCRMQTVSFIIVYLWETSDLSMCHIRKLFQNTLISKNKLWLSHTKKYKRQLLKAWFKYGSTCYAGSATLIFLRISDQQENTSKIIKVRIWCGGATGSPILDAHWRWQMEHMRTGEPSLEHSLYASSMVNARNQP